MKNIREAVHDVIEQRILPWIERDGISKFILPEQITPADCAKPIKCKQPCKMRHREHELGIGLTDDFSYCIDNKTFIFTPGRMVLLPAGTPHTSDRKTVRWTRYLDPEQPSSSLWMRVYPFGVLVQVSQIREDLNEMMGTYQYLLLGQRFSRLTTDLLEEIRSKPPDYAGVGQCLLMEFMHRCLRATAADADDMDILTTPMRHRAPKADSKRLPSRVQTAQEFIQANYHKPINLEDIAEAADSSVNHLGRQFKAATGLTPIAYLISVRVAAARELLLTDLKVLEVARLVGIENQYYFSRVFHNITGISPLQYRHEMVG